MHKKLNSVHIRIGAINKREFERDVYRPGVISLSRIIWGSLGGGLLLTIIGILSISTGIAVLYPPLAATCFINSTCVYLRVARPKPVIVGHFVASIGGLAGVWAGEFLAGGTELAVPLKLGLAVLFAAILMQVFDADHPPAAATAAIPAILPLPMPVHLFPVYMAWGATITVLFAFAWNRVWFEFPAKDDDHRIKHAGLFMDRSQILGLGFCVLSFVLMSCKEIAPSLHSIGIWLMTLGVLVLGLHHLYDFFSADRVIIPKVT
ncbi:MAG: HPP family protein [Proteobacteria bacterium]|nr:HPP family protein [Pseudomonadota bacterium]MBU1058099.1 HPP family protein [Pseudomonadota bacterium]